MTKIQLKRSNAMQSASVSRAPASNQLDYGELAINYNSADPQLFIKDSSGSVLRLLDYYAKVSGTTFTGDVNFDGELTIQGDSTNGSGQLTLTCEQNTHAVKIKAPAHSAAANYTLTLPTSSGTSSQVLTTDGSGNLSWAVSSMSTADKTKLDGIESGATADQTSAEIKSLYESESNTNAFTDAEKVKLSGVAAGAEVNVGTDLSYTATSRLLSSSTGGDVNLPEATPSQPGLLSAADKAKLNTIEASASADQTASEILTAIKTVDGAGSGLDADTVDGLNSSSIVQNSGGLTTNLDTFYNADMFGWATSTTGRPESYGQGISIVSSGRTHNNSNNWITQLAFGTSTTQSYFRTKVNSGGWTSWRKIWNSANDGAGSGLDADLLDGIDSGSFLRSDTNDSMSASNGPVLSITKSGSSPGNNQTLLVTNTYGNHSWGITGEFRIENNSGSDRPSILFSTGFNSTTWSVGYGYSDDNFRIKTGHGHRNGGWGTTRFSIDGSGTLYAGELTNKIWHAGNRDIYLNAGATGTTGNEITVGNSSPVHTLRDGNLRPIVQVTGSYPCFSLNHTTTTNSNHGPTIQFSHNGYDSNEHIVVGTTGQGKYLDVGFSGGGYGTNSNYNPHNGISGYNGVTPVRIFSNGVLVGATGSYPNHIQSTSNALEVRGSTEIFGVLSLNSSGSNGYGWIKGYPNNNHFITIRGNVTGSTSSPSVTAGHYHNFVEYLNNDSYGFKFKRSDTGTYTDICTITRAGLTHVGNITAYSDIRLKENIEVIPNALEKVLTLRGVTYNRTDLTNKNRQSGVIAQEVEQVLPEVVQENEEGIKSVAYGNMIGLIIESIKELKENVDDLTAELNTLKTC